jgi:hypothetical protein
VIVPVASPRTHLRCEQVQDMGGAIDSLCVGVCSRRMCSVVLRLKEESVRGSGVVRIL